MDLMSRKEIIFISMIFIGCTQAGTPTTDHTGSSYSTVPEDFNGTVCRFHISDSDANDIIKVNPGNDKTSEYFNIELSGSGNDVWVNVTVKKPLDRETLGSVLKISLSITDNQHNQLLLL
ncbi:uncharacterized protein LOC128552523 [Mercenaria mercenaria]|uniref:uncharacterized protein LOC128552523 n=1 Tax=Mercenaria mercenaria TaxID=6596 RepID=UPI00234E84E7|nr:uncharacterized protein LOC128552523 [Mercenaria mercenaria]